MLHEHHFRAMNTDVGVWLWSTAPASQVRRSLEWAEDAFARVEDELSRFRSRSGLSRLNQAAGRGPQVVSPLLWTVLRSALHAADESGGIYDPTLLRPLERIGYDRTFDTIRDRTTAPAPSEPVMGNWTRVTMDDPASAVSLPHGVAIDLGGIGKGWAVDHVASALAPLGPVLVDAGGDLRVIGTVCGEPWPIAVQDAFEPDRDRAVVRMAGGALATSSIAGRQWRCGARTVHHIIDPRTGTAAASDLRSVTVCAPSAAVADVAAKVALILGSVSGPAFLRARELSGLLTTVEGREVTVGALLQEAREPHGSVIGY